MDQMLNRVQWLFKIGRYVMAAALAFSIVMTATAAIDLKKVWNGELKLWELAPDMVKDMQFGLLPMSDAVMMSSSDFVLQVLQKNTTSVLGMMAGCDSCIGSWERMGCYLYWNDGAEPGETVPTECSAQWAKLWRNVSEKSVDKVKDRRLVKIHEIYKWQIYDANFRKDMDKSLFEFEKRMNKYIGARGKKIKETRPMDASGRKYSGVQWENGRCVLLLEKVSTSTGIQYIILTLAKDKESLSYKEPLYANAEVTAAGLAARVEEKDGMIMLSEVPPANLNVGYGNLDEDVLDVVLRYYGMGRLGAGAENRFWLPDGGYQFRHVHVDCTMNLTGWLGEGHKTKCGFVELWNQRPKKPSKASEEKWYKLVLENLRAGRPIMCYVKESGKEIPYSVLKKITRDKFEVGFHLIIGCDRSEGRLVLKTRLQEDGSEYVSVDARDFMSKCAAMYVLVPGGGSRSRKLRDWDSCKRDPTI